MGEAPEATKPREPPSLPVRFDVSPKRSERLTSMRWRSALAPPAKGRHSGYPAQEAWGDSPEPAVWALDAPVGRDNARP